MYICIERKLSKQKKIQFTGKTTTTTIYEIWFGFKCDFFFFKKKVKLSKISIVFYVT